jgi:8-oxo-dGTP pyrophosphatase MutT (NUDIX family)
MLKPWTCTARTTVGEYRVFRVEKLTMQDGEARPRGDFYTFACPDWVNVVAETDEGEIVLIWQYRFGTDALSLEVPGGVCEPGESPLETARRELREETGYEAREILPLVSVQVNPAIQNNACHTFLARGARRVGPPALDENEEIEVALVPAAQIPELIDERRVTHSLVVIALESYLRKRR